MCPGTFENIQGCNSWVISNLLTGDETWVHMFEPQRRADKLISNGSEKIKNAHVLPKELCSKKMYPIFFNLWANCSSALSIWSYSHWPILQEFCTEESERVLQ